MMRQFSLLLFLLIILTACDADAQPTRTVERGEIIYTNTFDDPNSWETFGFMDTQLGVRDGVYDAISEGGGYIPMSNNITHTNVIIEATTTLVAGSDETTYGILCRMQEANPSIAYYFLINGAGEVGVRIGEGNRIRVFIPWTSHPAINQGQDATNVLRAVCVDDYFAFYVNDRFIGEATQDWLTAGTMGLAITGTNGTNNAVQFDDVTIWDARLADAQ